MKKITLLGSTILLFASCLQGMEEPDIAEEKDELTKAIEFVNNNKKCNEYTEKLTQTPNGLIVFGTLGYLDGSDRAAYYLIQNNSAKNLDNTQIKYAIERKIERSEFELLAKVAQLYYLHKDGIKTIIAPNTIGTMISTIERSEREHSNVLETIDSEIYASKTRIPQNLINKVAQILFDQNRSIESYTDFPVGSPTYLGVLSQLEELKKEAKIKELSDQYEAKNKKNLENLTKKKEKVEAKIKAISAAATFIKQLHT